MAVVEKLQLTDTISAMLMAIGTLDEVMKRAQKADAWTQFPQ